MPWAGGKLWTIGTQTHIKSSVSPSHQEEPLQGVAATHLRHSFLLHQRPIAYAPREERLSMCRKAKRQTLPWYSGASPLGPSPASVDRIAGVPGLGEVGRAPRWPAALTQPSDRCCLGEGETNLHKWGIFPPDQQGRQIPSRKAGRAPRQEPTHPHFTYRKTEESVCPNSNLHTTSYWLSWTCFSKCWWRAPMSGSPMGADP